MIHDESLEPIDYVILGIVRSGVTKIQSIFKRLPKVSNWTIEKKVTNLKKLGLLELNEKDNWLARKLDPQFSLTDNGNNVIDKKIDELKGEYDKLVLLYENEDKEKLRKGMDSNKMFFPFMMLMGITNGMMFGSMLGMNHMMMGDYMQNTYDQGYMDGMGDDGFMDGFTDGDGGKIEGDLEKANIIVNRQLVPGDLKAKRHYMNPGGIRLGSSEVTRLGMKESDMQQIASLIKNVVIDNKDAKEVASDVLELRKNFQKTQYCFDNKLGAYEYVKLR